MVMAAVCLYPSGPDENGWQNNLWSVAKKETLTVRDWNNFKPNRPILWQEAFALASRAADWAERSGACRKPTIVCD